MAVDVHRGVGYLHVARALLLLVPEDGQEDAHLNLFFPVLHDLPYRVRSLALCPTEVGISIDSIFMLYLQFILEVVLYLQCLLNMS